MSFRRIPSPPRTVCVQRWWGASPDRSLHPARGTIHSVIALERHLLGSSVPSSSLLRRHRNHQTNLSQLSASDWSDLFRAATSAPCSNAAACHTFVITDYHVFPPDGDDGSSSSSSSSSSSTSRANGQVNLPFPVMSVVARVENDFEYNNHIYGAIQRSIDVDDLMSAFLSTASSTIDLSGPSMVEAAALLSPEYHKDCRMMIAGTAETTTATNGGQQSSSPPTVIDVLSEQNRIECAKLRDDPRHCENFVFNFFPHTARSIAYQNSEFCVLTNLKPVESAGHLLIVPKRIVGCLGELLSSSSKTNEAQNLTTLDQLGDVIAATIRALNRRHADDTSGVYNIKKDEKERPCDGFSVVIQQGKHAGQTVAHLHIHVIALTRGSGLAAPGGLLQQPSQHVIDPDAEKPMQQRNRERGISKEAAEKLEEQERLLREPRTMEMMTQEARELVKYFS